MADIFDQLAGGKKPTANSTTAPVASPSGQPQDIFDQLASGSSPDADVAARHAKTRAGKDIDYGRAPQGLLENAEDVGKDVLTGVGKSAVSTVQGVTKLANTGLKKIGVSAQIPVVAEHEDTEAHGVAENVGAIGENVLEFVAGAAALKGLSLGEKAARLAKVAKVLEDHPILTRAAHIGANALRTGTVGTLQGIAHGEDAGDALTRGAAAGVTGGALETLGAGVGPLKHAATASKGLAEKGTALAEDLAGGNLSSPRSVVTSVGQHLDAAEDAMHDSYHAGMQQISSKAKNIPISIAGSPLEGTAKELLSDSNVPTDLSKALKGVIPDAEKIEPFLKKVAGATESRAPQQVSSIVDEFGNPITSDASATPKTYSWDEMEATRQQIGKTVRKLPLDSPIRPDLVKLRSAIDQTMQEAADQAGEPDVAAEMKNLRSAYANKIKAFNETAIQALRDKNPDAVADILMNKSSVHNVSTLRNLIGSDSMKQVEGSLFDRLMTNASPGGELNGSSLKKAFYKLGPDVQQAIWGSRLGDVKQFVDSAAKAQNVGKALKLIPQLRHAGVGVAAWQLAHGDVKGAAETGGAMLGWKALSNPAVLEAATKALNNTTGRAVASGTASSIAQKLHQAVIAPEWGNMSDEQRQQAIGRITGSASQGSH